MSSKECYTGADDGSSCAAVDASAGILVRAYAGGDGDAGLGGGYYIGLRIWSGSVSIEPDSGCSGSATEVSVAGTITLKSDTSYNLGVAVDGDTLAVFVDGLYITYYTMAPSCSSGSVALASEYAAASFESMDVFDATLSVTSASLLVAAVATTAVTASATAESTAAAESAATSRDDANAVSAKAEAMASEAQAESAPKGQAGTASEAHAKAASEAQAEAASEAQAGATPALAPLAVHDALSLLAEGDALPSSSFERRRAAVTIEALYRPWLVQRQSIWMLPLFVWTRRHNPPSAHSTRCSLS